MKLTKKGQEGGTNWIVIGFVIAIFAALLYFAIFRIFPNTFNSMTSCYDRGGSCSEGSMVCEEGYYREYAGRCTDEGQICCMPSDPEKAKKVLQLTDKERKALMNPFIVTLDSSPTAVTEFNLKAGTTYIIRMKLNDNLPTDTGPFLFYLTDAKDDSKYYEFITKSDGSSGSLGFFTKDQLAKVMAAEKNTYLAGGAEKGKPITQSYTASLKDSYKDLTLHLVLLSKDAVKNNKNELIEYDADSFLSLLANPTMQLASKSYKFKINSVLEVTGLNTMWAADDQITLTCKEAGCTEFGLTILSEKESTNFDDLVEKCEGTDSSKFSTKVFNIVGTTIETNGLPLNLDIGGFRIPTQKEQLKYVIQEKPIIIVNNMANIKIDKATMLQNFYKKTENEDLFIGESTFICARAMISKKGETPVYTYAVSTSPLKVDILPPAVTSDNVQLIYPDPVMNNMNQYGSQYPSVSGQNYFYKMYPRVVVSGCYDYDQSGCTNYDYYLRMGDFITLNVNSNKTSDILTGIALTEGLNALLNYFAGKDPLNTVCPYIHSNEYRPNTQPEIRLPYQGQGMICIRIKDKAGNAVLVWKQIWSPEQMFKKIAQEAANPILGSLGS
ncbi:MAG: hypothetical protein V1866_03105 [archaeon]